MIIKSFEINKIDFSKSRIFLLYGENEGQKSETIDFIIKNVHVENKFNYEESEIIENTINFFNSILSKSFFENKKIVIISRASDKIKDIIEEISEKEIEDTVLIINAGVLDKRSKLRNFFEKNKKTICIPFYQDTIQNLTKLAKEFFLTNKIKISQMNFLYIINFDIKNINVFSPHDFLHNVFSIKNIIFFAHDFVPHFISHMISVG